MMQRGRIKHGMALRSMILSFAVFYPLLLCGAFAHRLPTLCKCANDRWLAEFLCQLRHIQVSNLVFLGSDMTCKKVMDGC